MTPLEDSSSRSSASVADGGGDEVDSDERGVGAADSVERGGDAADSDECGGDPASGSAGTRHAEEDGDGPGGREIVVPLRLYKTVTVFSTLIAVVAILAGFVLLDRGTQRATASPDEVSLPVVALGLALIVAGSGVYVFSTRFRTEGMGKPKDDTDEPTDNG